jgi:hypothetical protein
MSKLNSEVISCRKALSLLGLATLGLTVPATMLTVSDAEAQQPAPGTAPSTAPVTGTKRRQERRNAQRLYAKRRPKRRIAMAAIAKVLSRIKVRDADVEALQVKHHRSILTERKRPWSIQRSEWVGAIAGGPAASFSTSIHGRRVFTSSTRHMELSPPQAIELAPRTLAISLPCSSLERDFCRRRQTPRKRPEDDISERRPEIRDHHAREMAEQKRPFCLRAISCGFRKTGWWRTQSYTNASPRAALHAICRISRFLRVIRRISG